MAGELTKKELMLDLFNMRPHDIPPANWVEIVMQIAELLDKLDKGEGDSTLALEPKASYCGLVD